MVMSNKIQINHHDCPILSELGNSCRDVRQGGTHTHRCRHRLCFCHTFVQVRQITSMGTPIKIVFFALKPRLHYPRSYLAVNFFFSASVNNSTHAGGLFFKINNHVASNPRARFPVPINNVFVLSTYKFFEHSHSNFDSFIVTTNQYKS